MLVEFVKEAFLKSWNEVSFRKEHLLLTTDSHHKIYALEQDHSMQELSNYILENKVYTDGRTAEPWMCLLPNCHRISFHLKDKQELSFPQDVWLIHNGKIRLQDGLIYKFHKAQYKIHI